MFALRIKDSDKREIDKRASALDMSMSEYMIRAALGQLEAQAALDDRYAALERRVARLERLGELGGLG